MPKTAFARMLELAHTPRLRTMRQFAEEEVVIPDGPYMGLRFKCSRQPYSGILFDAFDSGLWNRSAVTGPTQSGKTLSSVAIPAMYHLFEYNESVIAGVPNEDMIQDKWTKDFLPAIAASRYRDLLPIKGSGSRGGNVGSSITFRNGATMRFMTGGSGDKAVAGYTCRVLLVTEVDGMDMIRVASRESDRINQLEGRVRAYGQRARVYLECTVSFDSGRIWQEYIGGTQSRLVYPCPRCGEYIQLERENLVGWQDAETEIQARDGAYWQCPKCAGAIQDAERVAAIHKTVMIHKGQAVDSAGNVTGSLPETLTLGFRWSAADNTFLTAGDLALDEFRARRSENEESEDRRMCQFVWCVPVQAVRTDALDTSVDKLMARVNETPRGHVPGNALYTAIGLDIGKFTAHWTLYGATADGGGYIIDYGGVEVPSAALGVEKAVRVALDAFRELCNDGWPGLDGKTITPRARWIDSGWQTDVVYDFTRQYFHEGFLAVKGFGQSQNQSPYSQPDRIGKKVKLIGSGYHVTWLDQDGVWLACINADHWKTVLNDKVCMPQEEPGAITFFAATGREHMSFARHLRSERRVQEFIAGKGEITRWEHKYAANHWLDSTYLAITAGKFVEQAELNVERVEPERQRFTNQDGQPYLVTER